MQYSDDLRRKLVEAWLTGEHTQAELAELFQVSLGWVEKVLRRWRKSGDTTAPPFHHGRYPAVSAERVRQLVARHHDATLRELGRRLHVSAPTVCRYLQQLGLPRKKRRCMPVNATPRVSSGCVRVGARCAVVWTRADLYLSTKQA
jgi:putative transposase